MEFLLDFLRVEAKWSRGASAVELIGEAFSSQTGQENVPPRGERPAARRTSRRRGDATSRRRTAVVVVLVDWNHGKIKGS